MAGAWTMTEEGEFILDPAYELQLNSIKRHLREQWLDTICAELASVSGYDQDELLDNFLTRIEKSDEMAVDIVDSFIIEALEGSI